MTLEQYLAEDANYNYFVAPHLPTRDNRTIEQRVWDAAEDVRVSLTGDESDDEIIAILEFERDNYDGPADDSWDGIAPNH